MVGSSTRRIKTSASTSSITTTNTNSARNVRNFRSTRSTSSISRRLKSHTVDNSESSDSSNAVGDCGPVVDDNRAQNNTSAAPTSSDLDIDASPVAGAEIDEQRRRGSLDKLTRDRNRVLDRWADAKTLGLTRDEIAINIYLRENLKQLFGHTGFNPRMHARNPVSVNMHNPRFSAALWAVSTEAYRRKGMLSRSQKEVISLGVSLSNDSPHCAFIHTAMGAAAGSDVVIDDLQRFYQTGDPEAGFPASAGQDPLVRKMASWTIKHRDREERERFIPCTVQQLPEVLGTVLLFTILNRVVDAFVSKSAAGPMFPLPFRAMMQFEFLAPVIQRVMGSMMSLVMRDEDSKVPKGQVLVEINKVAPIVQGIGICADQPPHELPAQLSWAGADVTIGKAVAFLHAEAELMASMFVPRALRTYLKSWVLSWDAGVPPRGTREEWLQPAVMESKLNLKVKGDTAMLRLMLVTVAASRSIDDDLISECQEVHGIRGTHAAVLYAAFLAAQRVCQVAIGY